MLRKVGAGSLGLVERMLVLRSLPAFKQLADDELAAVANLVTERVFQAGETLLRQGEPVDVTHVVVDGRVEILDAGVQVAVSERRIGIGSLLMLSRTHAHRTVRATRDTLVLELHTHRLRDLLEEHYALLDSLIRFIARETIDTFQGGAFDVCVPEVARPQPVFLPSLERDLDLVERILVIRQVPAFRRSSMDAVAQYAKLLEQTVLPQGEVLWELGEDCYHYYHMVHGSVRCEGGEGRGGLTYSMPGMPGFVGALADQPRWNRAVAASDVVALRVDREVLPDVLEDNFEMALNFLAAASRRLIQFLAMRDK